MLFKAEHAEPYKQQINRNGEMTPIKPALTYQFIYALLVQLSRLPS